MRITSVNISFDKSEHRQNKLAMELHVLCSELRTPNKKLYDTFNQLKSSSITKIPQEEISLVPGGAVGDRHFTPDVKIKESNSYYNLSAYKQVSLMSKERYTELNQLYGTNVQAGEFGENVQIEGFTTIEEVSQGTILQLGDTAQIRIMHLRTFCYKFSTTLFPTADLYFAWIKSKQNQIIRQIGVTGQVIQSGIVRSNDRVQVVHTPVEHVGLQYFDPLLHGVASRTPCDPPTNT